MEVREMSSAMLYFGTENVDFGTGETRYFMWAQQWIFLFLYLRQWTSVTLIFSCPDGEVCLNNNYAYAHDTCASAHVPGFRK